MTITKKTLKTEIDNIPDEYLSVVYRILRAFGTTHDWVPPFQPLSDDISTSEQVVAKIQSLPKDSANIEFAREPLIDGLNRSPATHDPSFDVQEWNRQWDEFETRMKQEELAHEIVEQKLNG
ncbi:MAG TPA: hypothetical protein P5121_38715 [Caldilineaceae bacterium]|nr:hypothetical protein [Caldilineaceae bacterium]